MYSKNTLNKIPIIVNPIIHTIKEYDKLIIILFLKAEKLLIIDESIFITNDSILSITSFWSLVLIILVNIAPEVTPNNNTTITKTLIFLLGKRIFLI